MTYHGGRARVLVGDARAVLSELCPAHLVLTSPPYNQGKAYEVRRTVAEYMSWIEPIAALCAGLVREGGSLCWQVGSTVIDGEVFPLDALFYPVFKAHGLMLRNRIVWAVDHGLHAKRRFSGRHETILWFTRGDDYTFNLDPVRVPQKWPNKRHFKGPKKGELSCNPLGANPGDVWQIPQVRHNHPEKTEHPCQYPEELCRRLILALTNPGDMVLDPFCGSGTTLAAAVGLDRSAIGIESNPNYARIIGRRLASVTPALEGF